MTQEEYELVIEAGLGVFVRYIPGDRVDDAYEALEAAKAMPDVHKGLLKRSALARAAVKKAFDESPRNSNGAAVLLNAAAFQNKLWEAAANIINTKQPTAAVAALVLEYALAEDKT